MKVNIMEGTCACWRGEDKGREWARGGGRYEGDRREEWEIEVVGERGRRERGRR